MRQVTTWPPFGGSSPHARGAPPPHQNTTAHLGIIPACAGSTRWPNNHPHQGGNHPRMRGEHLRPHDRLATTKGSSPHARGALTIASVPAIVARIIPACAGSTRWRCSRADRCRDHPRMRGEHNSGVGEVGKPGGSSPHARGAHGGVDLPSFTGGIIPACAGSTNMMLFPVANVRDHPRMRGEHYQVLARIAPSLGSSPHARGARDIAEIVARAQGIIPACAGSTQRFLGHDE